MPIQHARRFSRRRFLGGGDAGRDGGASWRTPGPVAADHRLRRHGSGWDDSPVSVGAAMAEEFLPSEGFTEVQYVDLRGSSSHKATAAGEIDFGSNFIGPTLTRLEGGDPLVLLSGTHVGCFELFAREQVRAVRDLKGKTMAVRQLGSTEHTFIASILAYVGIDPGRMPGSAPLRRLGLSSSRREQSTPSRRNRPNRKNSGRGRSAMCSSTARSTGPGPSITAVWCIRTRRLPSGTPSRPNGCCGRS